MVVSRAFSPGHVTGFFSIHSHEDPRHHGSTGAGFSLTMGVQTSLESASQQSIFLNGSPLSPAPVSEILARLFREKTGSKSVWTILHETSLPVGCGFGTSGAAALSLALALNGAEGCPLEDWQAGELAHLAELEARTGLGTVLAEASGGFELRTHPGAPGTGQVRVLAYEDSLRAAFLVFGPMVTPDVLANASIRASISREGEQLLGRLSADPRPETFLNLSVDFGRKAGLTNSRLIELQDRLAQRGILAPMLMFGDGLFTMVENSILESVLSTFQKLAPEARVFGSALDLHGGRRIVVD